MINNSPICDLINSPDTIKYICGRFKYYLERKYVLGNKNLVEVLHSSEYKILIIEFLKLTNCYGEIEEK